jgi:pimeloyl-ACP methyl ester carboxylesterase
MAIQVLYGALTIYFGVFLLLALMQRSLMYHPQRGAEAEYLARASQERVQPWRDDNGTLIGWKKTPPHAQNRMLILHGNGGDALARTILMEGLGALHNGNLWEFYCLEYPGYGWRHGNASQTTIVAAGDEALRELLKNDAPPLFLTGESLGTGVACLLAAKHPQQIRGLFLITPYTSTADVAAGRFPIYPVRLVMQDTYEAARALRAYSGPVAVLLAGHDHIVPTRFGRKLFDDYHGPKKLWMQPDADHNSLDFNPRAAWWHELSDFLLQSAQDSKLLHP